MPRETTSSITYRLKVPNFFTLPEYDGTSLEINSPSFEFANATWCFRFKPLENRNTNTKDRIKKFDIYLVRLHFKTRVQTIFHRVILLDADDKESDYEYDGHVFEEVEQEEKCLTNLNHVEPLYDRLTFIIHLFVSTEMDVQINRKGIREDIEMNADLISVTTDRGKQTFIFFAQNGISEQHEPLSDWK